VRPEMPSIRQGPSPRSALSSARLRTSPAHGLAADVRAINTFSPGRSPCEPRTGRTPVHVPRCRRERASLDLGAACRFLQPETTHGHTRRALDPRTRVGLWTPLLAGTNRCRLRWPCGTSPCRTTCEPRPARRARCTPRPARAGHAGRGPRRRSKGERTCRERRWPCPSRSASGTRVTRERRHPGWSPDARYFRVEIHRGRRLAKGRRPRENRGAFVRTEIHAARGGSLLRAGRNRASLTPPPWRHCSGGRAPFGPFQRRLALTSQAAETARPAGCREPKPPKPSGAQRP